MLLLRFGHFLGMALWIGGAVAAMFMAASLRDGDSELRANAAFVLSRMHAYLIAPGAVITVATGVLLTMAFTSQGRSDFLISPGMVIMQIAGIGAAVLALFVGVPTANQLATVLSATEGEPPPLAHRLRKRQAVVSSIAGTLAFAALFFGVVLR